MTNAITQRQGGAANVIESVIIEGDLARLTPEQRIEYYARVCESVGLNPYTKPFDYIRLNNRLVLYALKGATDQLRRIHGVSIRVVSQEQMGDVLVVTVEASDRDGRVDTEIGAVAIGNLKGDALANAMMKALTKAKRRVTLSICGLGMLDETEVDTIPSAQHTDHLREVPSTPPSNGRQIRDAAPRQANGNAPSNARQIPEPPEVVDSDTGEIIDTPSMQVNDPSAGHPATEKQIKAIFGIGHANGWTNDEIRAEMYERFLIDSTSDLTVAQASELIDAVSNPGAPDAQQALNV